MKVINVQNNVLPKIDKKLSRLLPSSKISDEELTHYISRLKDEKGFATIVVWKEINTILDGHFKYLLCLKHNIPYEIQYLSFVKRTEAAQWIILNQLQRRNLSKWQRSRIAIKYLTPILKMQAKANQKLSKGRGKKGKKNTTNHFEKVEVNQILAEKANVSKDIIRKVNYILKYGKKEDHEKAESGDKSINTLFHETHRKRMKRNRDKKSCKSLKYINDLSTGIANSFICKDVLEGIKLIPDKSAALSFTSPPFSCGKPYADGIKDNLHYRKEYLPWMKEVFKALKPKFRRGGRLIIEAPNLRTREMEDRLFEYTRPCEADFIFMMKELGYLYFDSIIWSKGRPGNQPLAWGSFRSPSSPVIRTVHSTLLIFCVDTWKLPCISGDSSELSKEDFDTLTKSIWHVHPETKGYGTHCCPMPVKLAEDVVKLFSFKNDLCIDIFGGSGTLAVACIRNGRRFIHVDKSPTYCSQAKARITEEIKKLENAKLTKKAA